MDDTRFREGCVEVTDDMRPGRPSTASKNIRKVLVILSDRRKSVDVVADNAGLSHGTVNKILKQDLNINNVRDVFHVCFL